MRFLTLFFQFFSVQSTPSRPLFSIPLDLFSIPLDPFRTQGTLGLPASNQKKQTDNYGIGSGRVWFLRSGKRFLTLGPSESTIVQWIYTESNIGLDRHTAKDMKRYNQLSQRIEMSDRYRNIQNRPWISSLVYPSGFIKEDHQLTIPTNTVNRLRRVIGFSTQHVLQTREGKLLYHSAALGIALDTVTNVQLFYYGHCPNEISGMGIGGGGRIAATGERVQEGAVAKIHVWNAETCTGLCVLPGFHRTAVTLLDVSDNGEWILSVGHDNCHTVALWRADGVPQDNASSSVNCGISHHGSRRGEGSGGSGGGGGGASYSQERLFPHVPNWQDTGRLCSWSETGTRPLTFCVLLNGRQRTTAQSKEEYDAVTGGVGHVTLWYIKGESLLPSKTVVDYDLRGILADPMGKAWMNNEAPRPTTGVSKPSTSATHRRDEDAAEGGEGEWEEEEGTMMKEQVTNVLCACIAMGKEIVTGDSAGTMAMWHPSYGDPVAVRKQAHQGEIWCIASKGEVIVTGGEDGYVRVWNVEMNCIGARSFPIQDTSTGSPVDVHWGIRSLSCVALRHASLRVALCTEDCRMFTFGLPGSGNTCTTHLIQEAHHSKELCAMAPHPTDSDMFVTGGDDRTVRVWRISTLSVLHCRQLPSMCRAVCWNPDGTLLAAGMGGGSTNAEDRRLDGSWVVFRSSDLRVLHHGRNSQQYITTIAFSPDGHYLAVGSLDSVVNVYDVVRGYILHSTCNEFNGFVSQLDWSMDSRHVRANSGFFELCFYDVVGPVDFEEGDEALALTPKEARDIQWFTNTCTLAWSNLGVWPTGAPVQVNSVDVAVQKCATATESGMIAAGNDDGIITLFRYPAPNRSAPFLRLIGHGPHISMVRWTKDEQYLISTGASDRSIMLWQVN